MKKILGLLAICCLVACNESGENGVVSPSAGNQNGYQDPNQNTQVNADSIAQHVRDSIAALYAQSSSSVDPFAGQLSSSSFMSSSSLGGFPAVSSSSGFSSSSAIVARSSSSKVTPKSSSAAADVDDGLFKLGLWDGTAGDKQVPTGNKTGGYWYMYDDSGDKGASTLTWGGTPGSEYGDDDLSPVIEACGGLCGTFDLVVGSNPYKPYVGVGFNYGKSANLTGDATSSKGVCVVYTSDIAIQLEMGLGAQDAKIGYANPFVTLPKATTKKTADFLWAEFDQPDWATTTVTNPQKALASLKFKFAGTTDGEDGGSGSFNIMKVGASGQCD